MIFGDRNGEEVISVSDVVGSYCRRIVRSGLRREVFTDGRW
jgi:hypothetical protein